MIMIDQSARLQRPLQWTRGGKIAVAVAVACLVFGLAGLGIYTAVAPNRGGAAQGCVNVTFASTLGAASLHACGSRARHVCATPGNYRTIGSQLAEACRSAGYTVPRGI